MMNSETFIYGMQIAHNALYKLHKPNSDTEFEVIKTLIEGFIMMLADFNPDKYHTINNFLLSHHNFDKDEVYLLYTYLTEDKTGKDKN